MSKIKLIVLIILSSVLFILAPFLIVQAYFMNNTNVTLNVTPNPYKSSIVMTLSDLPLDTTSPYYNTTTKKYTLHATNELAVNYVGKFKVFVKAEVHGVARLRFRIIDEWYRVREVHESGTKVTGIYSHTADNDGKITYPFSPDLGNFKWEHPYDDYTNFRGSWLYYKGIIKDGDSINKSVILDGKKHFPAQSANFSEEIFVEFKVDLEMIQANRIVEVWGLKPDFYN